MIRILSLALLLAGWSLCVYAATPLGEAIWLPKLLLDAGLVKSTSDGRRMVKQNAVSLDGEKVADVDMNIPTRGGVLIKVGKRRFCQVVFD